MTTREDPDGSLLLTYDGSLWSKWAIAATIVLLATAGYDSFIGARGDERLIGLLGGAATTAGVALILLEQSRFRVDPIRRSIDWETRWGFRRRRGTLTFADVRHVSVERPLGDEGVPSRRVVLHLDNGTLLPLTAGYRPDGDEEILKAADTLRRVLGLGEPTLADSVEILVEQGRKVDAIKLLVEQQGLSLREAKQRIEQLQQR